MITIEDMAAICKPHNDKLIAEGRADKLEAVLREVRNELRERIDGAEECRGRDTWISELIRICETVISD
jgi:hypothetical protein